MARSQPNLAAPTVLVAHAGRPRPWLRLTASNLAMVAVFAAVLRLGAALPSKQPGWAQLGPWLLATPVDVVAAYGLWLAVLAGAGYLSVVHLIALAGHLTHSASTIRLADRASAGLVSRVGAGVVAAGLSSALLAVSAPSVGAASTPGSPPPTMRLLPHPLSNAPAVAPATTEEATDAVSEYGSGPSDEIEPTKPTMWLLPVAPIQGSPQLTGPSGPAVGGHDRVWVVQRGDNLWDIAEATLRADAGPVDVHAVHAYWHRLVDTNRTQLADPDNPDLIFVGQALQLPTR